MNADGKFPCTKCGACCRRAKMVKEIIPYKMRTDGSCEMLNNENTCNVYKDRPLICNSEKLKELFPDINTKELFKQNALICNKVILEDGMDKKYLIDMNQF